MMGARLQLRGIFAFTIVIALIGSGCSKQASGEANANGNPADASAVRTPPPAPPPPVEPATRPVTLRAGSPLRIRTTSTLSSHENHNGEEFRGSLVEPLEIDGAVIAPRGASVTGLIADSDPGGRVKGRARLGIRLTSIERTPITTNTVWREAAGTKKKDAAKVAIGSGIGAVIGAIAGGGKGAAIGAGAGAGAGTGVVLATRGDPAVIPAESLLTFALTAPLTVEVKN